MDSSYIIGISGGSGSGKTTFVKELRKLFSKKDLCIISQDEYYKPRSLQEVDVKGVKNFDLPNSILRDEFYSDLLQLKVGKEVSRTEYTFNNELKSPQTIKYSPSPVIIVEGLFVYHFTEISKLIDLKIYIEAKDNLKVIRRIKRDRIERNYPIEDVLYRYEKHVLPSYENYILPHASEADLIINNNDNFENGVRILYSFIESVTMQQVERIKS